MNCYKSGSCGIYENRSCSECPASKPDYLVRNLNDNFVQKLRESVSYTHLDVYKRQLLG